MATHNEVTTDELHDPLAEISRLRAENAKLRAAFKEIGDLDPGSEFVTCERQPCRVLSSIALVVCRVQREALNTLPMLPVQDSAPTVGVAGDPHKDDPADGGAETTLGDVLIRWADSERTLEDWQILGGNLERWAAACFHHARTEAVIAAARKVKEIYLRRPGILGDFATSERWKLDVIEAFGERVVPALSALDAAKGGAK